MPTAAPEEGAGLVFRDGAFIASVHHTLVTVDHDKPGGPASSAIYTGVLRFDAEAFAASEFLSKVGQSFALEMIDGRRLSCRTIEPFGSTRLRWIVQLS